MSEKLSSGQNESEAPKLVLMDEETAFRRKFDEAASDTIEMAEQAIRDKNVADLKEEIGSYKERKKAGTLPEGIRDKDDFKEYKKKLLAEERAKRIEIVEQARRDVEEVYEKAEKKDEEPSFEEQNSIFLKKLRKILKKNPEIDTGDLLHDAEEAWDEQCEKENSPSAGEHYFLYITKHLDDFSKAGIELNANYLLHMLQGDDVAENAEILAKHNAHYDHSFDAENLFLSYGARLRNLHWLRELGYKRKPEDCLVSTDDCTDSKLPDFKERKDAAIIDSLDYLAETGIGMDTVVKQLSSKAVAENYERLERFGVSFKNPAKWLAVRRKKMIDKRSERLAS